MNLLKSLAREELKLQIRKFLNNGGEIKKIQQFDHTDGASKQVYMRLAGKKCLKGRYK